MLSLLVHRIAVRGGNRPIESKPDLPIRNGIILRAEKIVSYRTMPAARQVPVEGFKVKPKVPDGLFYAKVCAVAESRPGSVGKYSEPGPFDLLCILENNSMLTPLIRV
jgi:hypothetical protein